MGEGKALNSNPWVLSSPALLTSTGGSCLLARLAVPLDQRLPSVAWNLSEMHMLPVYLSSLLLPASARPQPVPQRPPPRGALWPGSPGPTARPHSVASAESHFLSCTESVPAPPCGNLVGLHWSSLPPACIHSWRWCPPQEHVLGIQKEQAPPGLRGLPGGGKRRRRRRLRGSGAGGAEDALAPSGGADAVRTGIPASRALRLPVVFGK